MNTFKSIFSSALIALLPFALSSCGGDTHEAVMTDMMSLTSEVADIIGTAKDKESAEAASKRIDAITSKFESLAKRAEALGEPSPEVTKELMEKTAASMGPVMMKMMRAATSLAENPEAAAALQPAMERFQKVSSSLGGK